MKIPTLTKLVETADCTAWKAEFHPTGKMPGAVYRVTTYPNSDEIVVTAWKRSTRITWYRRLEQIRAGLRHADCGCVVKYHETAA